MQISKKIISHRKAQRKYKTSLKGKITESRYAASSKGKKAKYRYGRNWNKENKFRKHVHYIVELALKDGRLVHEVCEVCGKEKTYAHHDDYYFPLKVRWLCASHHRKTKH